MIGKLPHEDPIQMEKLKHSHIDSWSTTEHKQLISKAVEYGTRIRRQKI